jgi:hypothetical protein
MMMAIVSGFIGMALHLRGNLAVELANDPSLSAWVSFKRALHAKAPPTMAPASMTLLGLLGLGFSYRHPALNEGADQQIERD